MIRGYVNRETLAYLIGGVLTTAVGYGVYAACERLGANVITANTVSTVLAVIFAFIVNKIFVFKSPSRTISAVILELLAFSAGRFAAYVAETGLLVAMVDYAGWPGNLCKLFTMALVVAANYIISKFFVFKRSSG